MAALLAVGTPARGELTVPDLTGTAVAGVGPYYQDVADAIKKFGAGDYRGALANLESAKKATPMLAPPEVMMARLYFDANMAAGGYAVLEQVARRLPADPEALVMLAERALGEGRWTEAELLFAKAAPAVEAFRDNPKRRQNLQIRLYSQWSAVDENDKNYAAAQRKLEQLLTLDTANAGVLERLGRVQFRAGAGEKAYEQFKAAAAADPKYPPAEVAMANMFTDKANAEKWINYALTRSGKDVRTQLAAGQYRLRENQLDEAKKHADEALRLDPQRVESNALAGVVARLQGDYAAAAKYLGAAHLAAPADASIMNHLALVLIELPDQANRQRALQYAELNARQHPNNLETAATFGWVNYRLGRRQEAERALGAVVKATATQNENRTSADTAYYLAVLAKDAGRHDFAIRTLRDTLGANQPFAYRKAAQALLSGLEKLDSATGAKTKAAGGT
jgi:tetratricopeptide (TPR) repeat protein